MPAATNAANPASPAAPESAANAGGRVSVFQVVKAIVSTSFAIGLLLFLGAGTWRWWRGWVIIVGMSVGAVATLVSLWDKQSGLLRERLKGPIQKGQPILDRILLLAFMGTWFGLLFFAARDVFHLHLLPKPGAFISSLGLALTATGFYVQYLAVRENAFASLVVRHQEERGQEVIDTGIYGVLRHPMYAGGVMMMIAMPVWLESYAGAIAAAIPACALVLRILLEERFLSHELPGYTAYKQRVRYRLIPFVW
jgi:protein-S-isoprenylcysteine O-methyltransferase Ste14